MWILIVKKTHLNVDINSKETVNLTAVTEYPEPFVLHVKRRQRIQIK